MTGARKDSAIVNHGYQGHFRLRKKIRRAVSYKKLSAPRTIVDEKNAFSPSTGMLNNKGSKIMEAKLN